MRTARSTWQDVALLVAGALISAIFGSFFQRPGNDRIVVPLGVVAVLLILYGSDLAPRLAHVVNRWRGAGRWPFQPSTGILRDMGWNVNNDQIFTWTDISPEGWRDLIQGYLSGRTRQARIDFITTLSAFERYTVIINPYGGVYLEPDLEPQHVLQKIFNYVARGGRFVNVADVPGYWAYSPTMRRRVETTPPVHHIESVPGGGITVRALRPYALTPFLRRLGLRVLGVEGSPLASWSIRLPGQAQPQQVVAHRVAIVEREVRSMVTAMQLTIEGIPEEVSPIFRVDFGRGQFMICLMPHNLHQNMGVRQLLAQEISSML